MTTTTFKLSGTVIGIVAQGLEEWRQAMTTQKESAEEYQELFDFFAENHNLTLTAGEMDEIVYEVISWHTKKMQLIEGRELIIENRDEIDMLRRKLEYTQEKLAKMRRR